MVERVKSRRDGNDHAVALADDLVSSAVQGPKITADQYAWAITSSWQKAVESIIKTGRLLVEAREKLPRGQWGSMVKTLPFGSTTAQALMRIARHPVLSDPQFIAQLPASWGTLSDLTTIKPEDAVRELIAAGKINAGMTRDEAAEVIREHKGEGRYEFDKIVEALGILMKFEGWWPEPSDISADVFVRMTEEGIEISVEDLRRITGWLVQLTDACGPLHEEWDRLLEEDMDDAPPLPPKSERPRPRFSVERILSKRDDRRSLDDDQADPTEPPPDELAAFIQEKVDSGEQRAHDE